MLQTLYWRPWGGYFILVQADLNCRDWPEKEIKKDEELSQTEQKAIKSYLSGVYEISEEKIAVEK